MRHSLFLALAVLAAGPAAAQSTATLRGVDVYRSSVLGPEEARRRYGDQLEEYVRLRNLHTPVADQKAEQVRLDVQGQVAARPGVAFAELGFAEFFTSEDHAMYAVLDVVDRIDSARLAFKPAPKGSEPDPDGLLAGWKRYMEAGETLSQRGEMSFDRPNCPGFYCLWSGTAEIDSLQASFKEGARVRAAELRRVLTEDQDGEKRAAALFVLSYSVAGRDVLNLCNDALSDPDPRVRGAALQILADVANHHPEFAIALARVLPCLDDPTASVRGKVMGLLVPLAERDAYRQVMLSATPRLVTLLKLRQPESRDLAYTLLGMLSRKTYDKSDTASWEKWAAKAAAGKP
jgi:hypothetical protein